MKYFIISILLIWFTSLVEAQENKKPNILIILSDDQGWGDVGFNGCTDIPTPNLDQLAKDGIVFSQGYATHPYCSPSRAGLLSGRYQHRFGHENNMPYHNAKLEDGLPVEELLISELLQKNNYHTCAIGKWHLGDSAQFWPINQGFEDWFGFIGGGLSYWGDTGKKGATHGVQRNGQLVTQDQLTYLTDDFSDEAINYIDQYAKSEKPFFMYLAYNAPHGPIQATKEYLDQVSHIENGQRAAYAAMVLGMDTGIGKIIQKLKASGEYENTLIFFYSDNGGHLSGASSAPFRGHKGMLFEGGIRVPFLISWPAMLKGGQTYQEMISALDIYPTILAASKTRHPQQDKLDGVNLLPVLQGYTQQKPHQRLFWRYSDGAGYAVRDGKYKLVMSGYKGEFFLFDLEKDPYEHHNLALQMPQKLNKMKILYAEWTKGTIPAKWHDPHAENILKEEKKRQAIINQARKGEKVKEKLKKIN